MIIGTPLQSLYNAPNSVIALLKEKIDEEIPNDLLFVEKYVWDFGLKFELAQAYRKIGEIEKANKLFLEILNAGVPNAYEQFILSLN